MFKNLICAAIVSLMYVDVEFSNSQDYKGRATAKDTPIEWAMYTVCREY